MFINKEITDENIADAFNILADYGIDRSECWDVLDELGNALLGTSLSLDDKGEENRQSNDKTYILTSMDALDIAKEACALKGFGIDYETPFYTIYDDGKEDIAISICKFREAIGMPGEDFFSIYVSPSVGDGWLKTVPMGSASDLAKELTDLARNVASTMPGFVPETEGGTR